MRWLQANDFLVMLTNVNAAAVVVAVVDVSLWKSYCCAIDVGGVDWVVNSPLTNATRETCDHTRSGMLILASFFCAQNLSLRVVRRPV